MRSRSGGQSKSAVPFATLLVSEGTGGVLACGRFGMLLGLTAFDVVAEDVALLLVVGAGGLRIFGLDGMNAGLRTLGRGFAGRRVRFCCGGTRYRGTSSQLDAEKGREIDSFDLCLCVDAEGFAH